MKYRINRPSRAFRTILQLVVAVIAIQQLPIKLSEAASSSRFKRFNKQNGLYQDQIMTLHQDQRGFMWFGSVSGLNRFDGYEFIHYLNQPDNPQSISDNYITDIEEDSNGDLWIATKSGGLNHFNYKSQQFSRYMHNNNEQGSISSNIIYSLTMDNKDNIWIGTAAGLDFYDKSKNQFKPIPLTPISFIPESLIAKSWTPESFMPVPAEQPPAEHRVEQPNSMAINTDPITVNDSLPVGEDLWLATDSGITIIQRNTLANTAHKLSLNNIDGYQNKNPTIIFDLHKDKQGNVWAGTISGLLLIDPKTEKIENISLPFNHPANTSVRSITSDKQNQLWIATANNGIFSLNQVNSSLKHYQHSPTLKDSLSSNEIIELIIDRNNILWAATTKGVSQLSIDTEAFGLQRNIPAYDQLSHNRVIDLYEDPQQNIWILHGKGIQRFNPYTEQYDNPLSSTSAYKRINNEKLSGITGRGNDIWIATASKGLINYKINENKIIFHHDMHENQLTKFISAVFMDNNRLWGRSHYGLFIYNEQQGKFIDPDFVMDIPGSKLNGHILDIQSDRFNFLWIASNNGLYQFKNQQLIKYHQFNSSNIGGLSSNLIGDIETDESGNLWLATASGLNKYDYETQTFSVISSKDGLADNTIYSILADQQDHLWLGTNYGLSRLNITDLSITNFHRADGIQGEEFNNQANIVTKDGKLVVGGTEGFNIFEPKNIITHQTTAPMQITQFQVSNKEVLVADLQALNKHIPENTAPHIILKHKRNEFAISFSALDYYNPPSLQYAFIMNGFHNDWVYRDATNRTASFTNLNPGQYTFKIKYANHHNQWSHEKALLHMTILPPWWLTNIAYISYFILFIISIYLLLRWKTHQLNQKALKLERIINDRTSQLQQQKSLIEVQAKRLEESIAKKDKIFTSISHEFRTPLTLIISPLNNMLKAVSDSQRKSILIIQRNAYRLLKLVNQLLDLSMLKAKDTSLKQKTADDSVYLKTLVNAISPSFQQLAASKQIQLSVLEFDDIFLQCSHDALEKILTNLLSNAIKYTLPQGKITLSVEHESTTDCLIIIEDTGIGIPDDQLENVFEPFMRITDHPYTLQAEGIGIGLSLVKELVDLYGGNLSLSSTIDNGTRVSVLLPIANQNTLIDAQDTIQNYDDINLEIMDLTNKIQSDLKPDNQLNYDRNENERDILLDQDRPVLLIIEDNSDMRDYLHDNFKNYYICLLADDGLKGVEIAMETIPDIILCDVMMPEMNGYHVCRRLKEDEKTCHIPIVLLTALGDREHKLKGLLEKADEYLTKPFDYEELTIRLDNLLMIRERIKKHFTVQSVEITETIKSAATDLEQLFIKHKDSAKPLDVKFVNQLENILAENYQDPDLNVEVISERLFMNRRQLHRKASALLGQTPTDLIRAYRIMKARQFLSDGKTVTQVSYDVGYSNPNYFTSTFKACVGINPKEYQKSVFESS